MRHAEDEKSRRFCVSVHPITSQLSRFTFANKPRSNINVFGLTFLVTTCCVLSALDLLILKILIFLKRFRRALGPRIEQWIQDGIFQILRRALEAHGAGTWEHWDNTVPVAVADMELAWGPGPCKCKHSLHSRTTTFDSSEMENVGVIPGTSFENKVSADNPFDYDDDYPRQPSD